jgi:hypothetical protein
VAEQSLGLCEPQPASGLPEQPGGDSAAAMLACDMQVADLGPPAVPGQPFALVDDLDLDVADYFVAQHHRQAGPAGANRPPDRQPGQWRPS